MIVPVPIKGPETTTTATKIATKTKVGSPIATTDAKTATAVLVPSYGRRA